MPVSSLSVLALGFSVLANQPAKSESDWITGGPGSRVIDVMNAPYKTFQEKLTRSLEKAIGDMGDRSKMTGDAQGLGGNAEVYIRGGYDGFYTLTAPVVLDLFRKPTFRLRCDPSVVIDFIAPGGAAVTFKHSNGMRIENLNVRLGRDSTTGIQFRHNARTNHLYKCSVIMPKGRRGCIGIFLNGDNESGRGGADISFNRLEMCSVFSQSGEDKLDVNYTGKDMGETANENNVGFCLLGGDLMANVLDGCQTARLRTGFAQDSLTGGASGGTTYSGNGLTTYRDCSADYCYVGWHFPGNGQYNLFGGRSENTGCYVLFGPKGNQDVFADQNGLVGLFGVEFSQTRVATGVANPMCVPGSLIDARSTGSISIINSVITHDVSAPGSKPMRLYAHKGSKGRASMTIMGSRVQGSGPGIESPSLWSAKPGGMVEDRPWQVVVDESVKAPSLRYHPQPWMSCPRERASSMRPLWPIVPQWRRSSSFTTRG